jgi:diaminopimelate epimerase
VRVEKWQALGNHFLLLEQAAAPFPVTPARARLLCDDALGFGADGVLELQLGGRADVEVVVHNRDGSVAEISGNGTRIACAWAAARLGREALSVHTGAGLGRARRLGDGRIAVTMGRAALGGHQYAPDGAPEPGPHRFVSTGNPHCVLLVDEDPGGYPLHERGPALENHHWFPERANVEVVNVQGPHRLRLRVWERGVGETRACGSGACAAAVAAVVEGRCQSPVAVAMPGGELEVTVEPDLSLELAGRAEPVYAAEASAALLARLTALH